MMSQDDLQKILEVIAKSGIKVEGDLVAQKHVECEFKNFGTIAGDVVLAKPDTPVAPRTTSDYSDEVVGKAIIALDGYKKPLCEKQLFLAIIKVLCDICGWCGKWQTCCDRINELPIIKESDMEVKCDYNNLKAPIALKFASLQYKEWEDYEPRDSERDVFRKNKNVAKLFEEELERQIQLLS